MGSASFSRAFSHMRFICFSGMWEDVVLTKVKRPSVSWLVSSPRTVEICSSSRLTASTYVSKSEWTNSMSG